jgi:ribose 5-phosphate isomerase B
MTAQEGSPHPLPSDGKTYPLTGLKIDYQTPQPQQPPISELMNTPIRLGVVSDGYVSPREGVPVVTLKLGEVGKEGLQKIHRSGIAAIYGQIVHFYNARSIIGVFVVVDANDIDANDNDIRPPDRTTLQLIVVTSSVKQVRTVAIGADHGGYPFKEQLKEFLAGFGVQINDFGTNSTDAVDYPDYAHAVAKAVSEARVDVGIIVDGAGIGSAMTANKVPGVRAAACYNAALARNSREHNGANVLTLGSGQNSSDELRDIVTAFLTTELTEERHKRRVGKIDSIEKQYKR